MQDLVYSTSRVTLANPELTTFTPRVVRGREPPVLTRKEKTFEGQTKTPVSSTNVYRLLLINVCLRDPYLLASHTYPSCQLRLVWTELPSGGRIKKFKTKEGNPTHEIQNRGSCRGTSELRVVVICTNHPLNLRESFCKSRNSVPTPGPSV